MAAVIRSGQAEGLQLSEDVYRGRRAARSDTVTWVVLLIIMAAIAAGVFGRGPVSHATARSRAGLLELDHERFERYGAFTRLTLRIVRSATPVEVIVSTDYLDAVHLQRIVPAPVSERRVPGGVAYQFAGQDVPVSIQFDIQPMRRGRIHGSLTTAGDALAWWHFIYP